MKMSRSSGILLHPSSLPETSGIGTIGAQAYRFVDWLKSAKQSVWQILPLGPTGYGDSPYASFSTYAGNPLLIDLDMSKKDLAEKAGLSAYTITKMNKGEVVKADTLAKICKTLNCSFDDIMEIVK